MPEVKSYPVGTKLVVLPRGVGQGMPELKLGEICIVKQNHYGNRFDFTIGADHHSNWRWSDLGTFFALLKKKPTIIVMED